MSKLNIDKEISLEIFFHDSNSLKICLYDYKAYMFYQTGIFICFIQIGQIIGYINGSFI
jgi:hypothetical protein